MAPQAEVASPCHDSSPASGQAPNESEGRPDLEASHTKTLSATDTLSRNDRNQDRPPAKETVLKFPPMAEELQTSSDTP